MNSKFLLPGTSKKTLAIATALAITASGLFASPAQADLPDEGTYSCATGLRSDDASIPKYQIHSSGAVYAGSACTGAVVIPEGVITIGGDAFNSSQLTSITIPNTVTIIDDYAFAGATALTSIAIPNSVTYLGSSAFQLATALTSITLSINLTSIEPYTFRGATSLTSITIPNGVTSIGHGSFQGASSLPSIIIPNNVTLIGAGAFQAASSLTAITIPNGVTSIADGTFYGATSLSAITIPNSVTSIGEGAFAFTLSLSSLVIPNSVTSIGVEAFLGANSLESVNIPNGVTSISDSAFSGTALDSITIPSSVNSIGDYAFYASRLRTVNFLGDAPVTSGNAFANIRTFAKAFIEPSAVGFQPSDDEAAGYGDSQVEIFWNNLIVRPASSSASSLYRTWQTPLPESTSSLQVGDTVYASAFERELSRGLYKPDDTDSGTNYRSNSVDYPTLEEYVYRITKSPNVATSSVDRQSNSTYDSLSAEDQDAWYASMGFDPDNNPYRFSWSAFMCLGEERIDEETSRTIWSKPTGLALSYASREDGLVDSLLNIDFSHLFRDLSIDAFSERSPTTRTLVGSNYYPFSHGQSEAGADLAYGSSASYTFGVSEVTSDCGVGKALIAIPILDTNDQLITSKSFEIPATLRLAYGMGGVELVSSEGVTIGVTGNADVQFNAALWGLTTIAGVATPPGANPPPGANQPSGSTELPGKVPTEVPGLIIDRTKSTVFAGFAGDSSRLTSSLRKAIVKLSSGFKKVSRMECTGFTSGTSPSRFDVQLAKNRAKAACDLVRQNAKGVKGAKVLLRVNPATGQGAKFRSVQVKITGN